MVNHPQRTPAIAARNRWREAAKAWESAAVAEFGPDFTYEEARGVPGSELALLFDRMTMWRDAYHRHLVRIETK